MSKSKLAKIVYFDEDTALDYVEIRDRGKYIKAVEQEYEGTVGGRAETSAKTPRLFSMFRLGADMQASAEAKRIARSTVSNTILTDFIEKAEQDGSIERLAEYDIELTEETRLTIYSAITDVANGSLPIDTAGMALEVSKFGTILKSLQGYLELNAVKDGNPTAILRFNSGSFRNNYRLADIINMNLIYYGIKVGATNTSTLKSLGLDLTNQSEDMQARIDKILTSDDRVHDDKGLDVYDIILAGVFSDVSK